MNPIAHAVAMAVAFITTSVYAETKSMLPYPQPDVVLGEQLLPNEEALVRETANIIEKIVRKEANGSKAHRDAHPKAHGCVRAEFQIENDIPNRLAKGVFLPGKQYAAWIRFSNGNPDASKPDIEGNERGMSIKLLGVQGDKILENERHASTQDFIMMSHPVFFMADASNAVSFYEKLEGGPLSKLGIPLALGWNGTMVLLKINDLKIANPLQTRYWSPAPIQLGQGDGRQAIKFSARACKSGGDIIPDKPSPNFLREAMINSLNKEDACMEFLIQPKISDKQKVEDARSEWLESDAPFVKVATIRIPKQKFDTPEQNAFCENLSFTPWHAIPEHKPLGSLNRLRKVVYDQISVTRHNMNGIERQEP
ncbi:catalase family protein [Undibacterium sp. Jales W-56]|uniref:catalase family protein n=1 Tax=Undibacterium sp. Jales W-56 TaxID=2897325 RepID=UPI0021D25001|nr:catalase family protein [Undibacterium sp. Jales W-56]MCU6434652.1 catalase family protein [Undibacterium sp. Jales W-56]